MTSWTNLKVMPQSKILPNSGISTLFLLSCKERQWTGIHGHAKKSKLCTWKGVKRCLHDWYEVHKCELENVITLFDQTVEKDKMVTNNLLT